MYEVWADGSLFKAVGSFKEAKDLGDILVKSYNVFYVIVKRNGKAICAKIHSKDKWIKI